jgi:integrase
MPEKQHNERKATRFEGVYQRESRVKRHKGKPDICYSIDYRSPATGHRERKTVGWKSRGVTAEYAHAVRTALLGQAQKDAYSGIVPITSQDVPTLSRAWEMYRADWLEARQTKTRKNDASIWRYLQKLENRPLNQISARDLEGVSADIQRKGLSTQTARHALGLARRIMRKMILWNVWTGPAPFAQVAMPRVNNRRDRYLTPVEATAILDALRGLNPRMYLMSLLSLHCGMRFGEIAALRHADLDFTSKSILVRDPKNGHDRHAYMTETVRAELAALPPKSPSDLLFPGKSGVLKEKSDIFDDIVKAWEFNAGITDRRQKVVFHTLRHTYASWLAKSGAGQTVIAEMLGHSSLEMSRRYTHLMPDAKREAASAIDAMFNAAHQEPRR